MNLTEKLIAAHAGADKVAPGQLVTVNVDLIMANDITAPVAIAEVEKKGATRLNDSNKIVLVLDHFTPNKDIKSAEQCKLTRQFAKRFGIRLYEGGCGIEHALLPEKGLVAPSSVVIGADSHTCTYGALGAFATGMGSTDIAYAMLTGKTWLRVPETIKIEIKGTLPKYVTGKDVVLTLIGKLGVDGARYKALEFGGNIGALSIDDRFSIANMAVECGAKNGIFPADEVTKNYLDGRLSSKYNPTLPDADARYEQHVELDLSSLEPVVAFPHLPSNVKRFGEFEKTPIDQVVIGSCTNGRITDMRRAAELLSNQRIADGVRCLIIPASAEVYAQSLKEGLLQTFVDSGAIVCMPTCGPCLGGHTGILAAGERCVSTTNRNFVGRMGSTQSEVYLASPYVAAASAIKGYIASPAELLEG